MKQKYDFYIQKIIINPPKDIIIFLRYMSEW